MEGGQGPADRSLHAVLRRRAEQKPLNARH